MHRTRSVAEDDADPEFHAQGKGTAEDSPLGSGTSSTRFLEGGAAGGGAMHGDGGALVGGGSGPYTGGGILGGGATGGGAMHGGGGVHGGGRPENQGGNRTPMPKISFPHFDGTQPWVWRDKCLDYFRVFNIHPSLWITSATLHMDGKAALWLQTYKLHRAVLEWPLFITDVEQKFGADAERKSMKTFLQFK